MQVLILSGLQTAIRHGFGSESPAAGFLQIRCWSWPWNWFWVCFWLWWACEPPKREEAGGA